MDKQGFISFLEENILSIFTGSYIEGEVPSSVRDSLVAQGKGGRLLVKFNKDDDYRIVIRKIQPFKTFEVSLVRSIITELIEVKSDNINDAYFSVLQKYIIEKAICKSVSETSYRTMLKIVSFMNEWASRTDEGNRVGFGIIVSNQRTDKTQENLHISNVLSEPFSAVLADGIKTTMLVSYDGFLLDILDIPDTKNKNLYAPYDYVSFANMCVGTRTGVVLSEDGDILIFHNRTMVFAKKSGVWVRYGHEEVIEKIANNVNEESAQTRRAIYLSALDVSFARTGGCVVHLDKDESKAVLKHIDETNVLGELNYDIKCKQKLDVSFFNFSNATEDPTIMPYAEFLQQDNCVKIASLMKLINGRKFFQLSRKLRQELMAIDGATIIDNEGDIVAIGAIIMIEAGGFSGGRLAAAKTLAKFGVSLKISNDGQIQGFMLDKHKLRPIPIFMLG